MNPPTYDPAWPDDVQALYRHDMQEIWDRSLSPNIWNLYHDQLDRYIGIAGNTPLKILDVGCAQATLALLLAERGHRVTAVDIRPQFLDYARSRYSAGEIEFLAANILDDELAGGYDLVFANQIIEHLVYPVEFLSRLLTLLKPGGRLVVTTPNGQYLKNDLPSYRELGDPRDWEHKQFTADGDGHFFAYRRVELQNAFAQAGFGDVVARCFETPFMNGHMKVRYLHSWMPARVLQLADRAVLLTPWLGRALAHQLMVIGIRPGSS
jgi:2-polyprenyl-6-hydroxyphenyl methylase/3-demethylubiquinone-9 3-methyltransferase